MSRTRCVTSPLAPETSTGSVETVILSVATLKTGAGNDPESLLAAVAATWALGVPADLIGAGLRTFDPRARQRTPA